MEEPVSALNKYHAVHVKILTENQTDEDLEAFLMNTAHVSLRGWTRGWGEILPYYFVKI